MRVSTTENDFLGEKVFTAEYDCGFKAQVMPKPGFNTAVAVLAAQYGAIDSHFVVPKGVPKRKLGPRAGHGKPVRVPSGIAHFLEHKMFHKKGGPIFNKFAGLGASVGAFTTGEATSFTVSTIGRLSPALKALFDLFFNPHFTSKGVNAEREIILQELKMYKDHPQWNIINSALGSLYFAHPIKEPILGTENSIKKITPDDLYLCHDVFYHPSNSAAFIAGDVNPRRVFHSIEKLLDAGKYRKRAPVKRIYPKEKTGVPRRRTIMEMPVGRPIVLISFKDPVFGDPGRVFLRRYMLSSLLATTIFAPGSSFYRDAYEAGLIDDASFLLSYSCDVAYGFLAIGTSCNEPERFEEAVLAEIHKVRSEGVDGLNFRRTLRKTLGATITSYNEPEASVRNMQDALFSGAGTFDQFHVIKTITVEDVDARFAELVDPDNYTVSIIEPAQ